MRPRYDGEGLSSKYRFWVAAVSLHLLLFWEATSRTSAKLCFTRKATDTTNEHLSESFPRDNSLSWLFKRTTVVFTYVFFIPCVWSIAHITWMICTVRYACFLTDLGLKLKCSHGQLWFRNCFHLWGSEAERQRTSVRANFWLYPSSALLNPKAVRRRPSPQWTLD